MAPRNSLCLKGLNTDRVEQQPKGKGPVIKFLDFLILHAKLHPSLGLEGLVQPPCLLTHLNFRAYHRRLAFTSWTAPGSRCRILEVTLWTRRSYKDSRIGLKRGSRNC